MDELDWQPWKLGTFFPDGCGGHSYCDHPTALADFRRSSEKAYRATGRFQVVHHHPHGKPCNDRCEAYGDQIPRLET